MEPTGQSAWQRHTTIPCSRPQQRQMPCASRLCAVIPQAQPQFQHSQWLPEMNRGNNPLHNCCGMAGAKQKSIRCSSVAQTTEPASRSAKVRLRPVTGSYERDRRRNSDWFFTERGQREWVSERTLYLFTPILLSPLLLFGQQEPPLVTATCLWIQVDAMELKRDTGMELAAVLREMGISYDPQRLASALRGRELEISARALRITYSLGRFVASIAKVWLIQSVQGQGIYFLPHTSSCSRCDCKG